MNPKKSKAILVLLMIVIVSLVSINLLVSHRNNSRSNALIASAIEGTRWPIQDVPLLAKEGLKVEDYGEYNCQVSIPSGVTYDDIRGYLIQLYKGGFEPYEEYGSQNPNRLMPSSSAEHINEITWIAEKDNYYLMVMWAKEGATDELDMPYEYNLDMNLFINPGITNFSWDEEEETENNAIDFGIIGSGESELSGE